MTLRDEILVKQKQLSPQERDELSEKMNQRLIAEWKILFLKAKRIALYRPLPTEVSLDDLEEFLFQEKKELCYPLVLDDQRMEMKLLPKDQKLSQIEWWTGRFGIQEPQPSWSASFPNKLDLIVVPGVLFGERAGERIGRGKGYYDRYLKETAAIRVGVAFDFQVQPSLDQNAWDQKMDVIVTDKRLLRFDHG